MTRLLRRSSLPTAAVISALLLVGLCPLQASGQTPDAAPSDAAPPHAPALLQAEFGAELTHPELVQQAFFALRDRLASGADVQGELAELTKLREQAGVATLRDEASALTAEGFRLLEAGQHLQAAGWFDAARKLAPDSADAILGAAAAASGRAQVSPTSFGALVSVVRSRLTGLSSFPFAAANWLQVLCYGLLLGGLLTIIALTIRAQSQIRFDVEETLRRTLGGLAPAAGWLALFLPLLLSFDLYWAALYWAVLVAAYSSVGERVVLTFAVVLMALFGPAMALVGHLVGAASDGHTQAIVQHVDGWIAPAALGDLEAYAAAHADEAEPQILLAQAYERLGRARDALAKYRALADQGASPQVLTNMGSVHYRLGEKDQAVSLWNQALTIDSTFAPAHYNLSLYYQSPESGFDFDKQKEHFGKAKDGDPALISRWVQAATGRLIETGPDRDAVTERLLEANGGASQAIKAALFSPALLAAVVALIAIHGWGAGRSLRVARACVKCGTPFSPGAAMGKNERTGDYCLQCVHLFIKKDGVSPQMRTEKMSEIASHQRWQRVCSIVIGVLAPGAGQLYRRNLLGFGLLLAWGLGLAVYLCRDWLVLDPGFVARAHQAVPFTVGLMAAAVVWIVANVTNLMGRT